MKIKNIIIGSDHAGFLLKEELKKYLAELGCVIEDIGVYTEQAADYPVIAAQAAKKAVSENKPAVLICGTGIGMSIAANKIKGARAALCYDASIAKLSRKHNNANILCLGARMTSSAAAKDILQTWLDTDFEAGRHQKRIDMIE